MNRSEHCRIPEYTLKYYLCGKLGCEVCAKIARGVRTLNKHEDGNIFRNKVMRWIDLLIVDSMNNDRYLSREDIR